MLYDEDAWRIEQTALDTTKGGGGSFALYTTAGTIKSKVMFLPEARKIDGL
jgi:hypothetical protein